MTETNETVELTAQQMDELDLRRPQAVALLRELNLQRCQVTRDANRTGLLFTVPDEQIIQAGVDPRRFCFDTQKQPTKGGLYLVIDCTLEELSNPPPLVCVPPTEPVPTLQEIPAKFNLQVHRSVPWSDEAGCVLAAEADGWQDILTTPHYVPGDDAEFTLEEHAKFLSCILQDLAFGITTYCEREPGKYKHVTEVTIVCESPEDGAWGYVHLK